MDEDNYKTYAIVHFSEGVPKKPEIVEVKLENEYINFSVNYMGYFNTTFRGSIIKGSLEGKFSKPLGMAVKLQRNISYWHRNSELCGGFN
jgi:hypothetical protein